jgi:enoyl-CoA hydratase/carnithine racemase
LGVIVDDQGALTIITIDRPEVRNALDPDTMAGIGEALPAAERAPEIRAFAEKRKPRWLPLEGERR